MVAVGVVEVGVIPG